MSEITKDPLQQARAQVQQMRQGASDEHKAQFDALARLLDEAAATSASGDDAAALQARLDEVIQTTAKFSSLMVHEIRIPLTSIKGYTDMLAKHVAGPLNEMQQQFADTVRSNVSRMEHLVTDVSDASKLYAGRIRLEPQMDMYKNLAMQVEKNVAALADAQQHKLTFDTPGGLPLLNVDSERFIQALTKLVTNALLYTPEGGEITVRAEGVDGKLKVSVIDNGIGMTPEEQAHIGERFWRADHDVVQAQKGHGLGLAIAMGLVELMGGEFFWESAPGAGSTFGFVVPGMS